MASDPLELTAEVAQLLERLSIRYAVGGSIASSLVGEPRATVDIDMAVNLDSLELDRLLDAVDGDFYVPLAAAQAALEDHGSFNIIQQDGMLKIDFFVLGQGPLDTRQISRRVAYELPTEPPASVWVTSAEDQVLRKLDWYRQGGASSDRQWRDVCAILRINSTDLDHDYLDKTALLVGLTDLLASAWGAVGSD